MKLVAFLLVLFPAVGQLEPKAQSSKPTVAPMFMALDADTGPAFFIECRNTTNTPASSGSVAWPITRSSVRLDGTVLEESEGRIGPGLTTDVQAGALWRGIIELRQTASGRSRPVALGANVRAPLTVPLTAGRHTIAVRCAGTWSDDVTFYWEK